jgi:hypothetical protein
MRTLEADLILCWPNSADYPLFRDFLLTHKKGFKKIIIVFTQTNSGRDWSQFVMESLLAYDIEKQFVFIKSYKVKAHEDWRNVAVNKASEKSSAKWVWFIEQDLFILDQAFWTEILKAQENSDVIGYMDGKTRLHPSNLWVKRSVIDKTSKDFGIVPDKLDHFAKFFNSLQLIGSKIMLIKENEYFYHMNGLSHNFSLISNGGKPNYKPDEFQEYIQMSLQIEPINEDYKKICEDYLNANI